MRFPENGRGKPVFTEWDTPHGVPPFDKILPEHFMPAFERGMSLHEAEIDAITSNKDEATFENTILAYDNAGRCSRRPNWCSACCVPLKPTTACRPCKSRPCPCWPRTGTRSASTTSSSSV